MKTAYKKLLAATALICSAVAVSKAQNALTTGYFTDGYVSGHQLNPALTPNKGYFSIPFLNMTVGTGGNITLDKLFYTGSNGKLVTFLHNDISAEQAAARIKARNSLNMEMDDALFALGFFNKKGTMFTNIGLDVRVGVDSNIPGDVFNLLKSYNAANPGSNDYHYNLGNLEASAMAYAQLSFGQSYRIAGKVNVGYKVKFLFGAMNERLNYSNLTADLNKDKWCIKADGQIDMTGIYLKTQKDEKGSYYDIRNGIAHDDVGDLFRYTFGNFGLAADLGVSWDINKYWQVSAAVQDLGFLNFKHSHIGTSDLPKDGIVLPNRDVDPKSSIKDQLNTMIDDFKDLTKFRIDEKTDVSKRTLSPIVRAGVLFRIPVYDKIGIGALYSHRINKNFQNWEVRGSVNYDILRWLALSVSYANGTFGSQFGALLNIHAEGIAFHVGADNIPFSYSVQGLPVKTSAVRLNAGLSILFDKYFGRYPKK